MAPTDYSLAQSVCTSCSLARIALSMIWYLSWNSISSKLILVAIDRKRVLQQQMLEQLKIQKQSVLSQPPQSPSGANRLQQYFDSSSFLLQQQQLAIFIRDLPIINLKQVKSINTLISMLIKQNQLVGQKCQQQVSLLKESYLKHDKLVRSNKEMKLQKQKIQKEKRDVEQALNLVKNNHQSGYVKKQQVQYQSRKLQAENLKSNVLLKQANDKIKKFQELLELICAQQYKKCEDFSRTNVHLFDRQLIVQDFCQAQRRKSKYFGKIKQIVQQFCIRLEKIAKVVSSNVLASELGKQSASMLDLIQQIISENKMAKGKKKKTQQSDKMLSSVSQFGSSKRHSNSSTFFEGMIQKLTQTASNNNTTKQSIAIELQEMKNSLQQSKSYYEAMIKHVKEQLQQKQEQMSKRMLMKQQTAKFYEEELQKSRSLLTQLKQENQILNTNLNALRRDAQNKNILINDMEQRIDQITKQSEEEIQRGRKDADNRVQEIIKMSSLKIEQRDEVIKDLNQRRKKQQIQHQTEKSQLKFKIKLLQEQLDQKQQELKAHIKNIHNLQNESQKTLYSDKQKQAELNKCKLQIQQYEDKVSARNKQIEQYRGTLNSLQHQKNLQAAYISELEAKTQTLNNKIQNLQSKTKNQATNKKQLTAMKNTIVEQKQRNEQYEAYCSQMKQQNQRLKSIVKQMKKQLQEVYVRLSQLKQIESDRERLILQAQNSQRFRDGLTKQHEELKFQMLKLETENKKLHLELKHFRNIVSRIKFDDDQ